LLSGANGEWSASNASRRCNHKMRKKTCGPPDSTPPSPPPDDDGGGSCWTAGREDVSASRAAKAVLRCAEPELNLVSVMLVFVHPTCRTLSHVGPHLSPTFHRLDASLSSIRIAAALIHLLYVLNHLCTARLRRSSSLACAPPSTLSSAPCSLARWHNPAWGEVSLMTQLCSRSLVAPLLSHAHGLGMRGRQLELRGSGRSSVGRRARPTARDPGQRCAVALQLQQRSSGGSVR